MTIGTCYFPEHWPEERREEDVARMAEAGLEYVRLGEFAWGELEPACGEFRFGWLREVLDLLADEGLRAVLCTPTATPPKWLTDAHPEVLRERADGTVEGYGSRRHYCFNSDRYRAETRRIVTRMAAEFSAHEAVVGWQVDNEFGCHDTIRCYCADCGEAFREWLSGRYESVDALNEAWGTAFWSQRYPEISAVEPPGPTPSAHHPALSLAYARFASDSVRKYCDLQTEILREANSDWFVTHNLLGEFDDLDVHDLRENLDFLAWDSYPTGFVQTRDDPATPDELRAGDPDQLALQHALVRGTDDSFWVTEQQPGTINWSPYAPQPAEGAMALWAHHAVAHGAQAVLYFRWRACTQGQEQYHAGLLDHAGRPDRGLADAERAAAQLDELGEPAPPEARVALLHSYPNLWALSTQPQAPEFDYWSHVRTYFSALRARGATVDVIPPGGDFDDYKLLVAPTAYLATDALADRLAAFVRAGGHLLLTIRSGVKDPQNRVRPEPRPGPLAELAGSTVERHETLPEQLPREVRYGGEEFGLGEGADRSEEYGFRCWAEWLELDEAEPVGVYTGGEADGRPAIARNEVGDGSVTYVGVWPDAALADRVVADVLERTGVGFRDEPFPDGVRVVRRGERASVFNFSGDRYEIDFGNSEILLGSETVAPYSLVVLEGAGRPIRVEAV